MPHFHFRRLHTNVYDVFIGSGWDEWTRIRVGRDYSTVIGGNRLPTAYLKEIATTINK